MGRLTTHVLDTASGKPAAGMRIDFTVRDATGWQHVKTLHTNAGGRTDEPLMTGDAMRTGEYELVFHVAEYFRSKGQKLSDPDRKSTRLNSSHIQKSRMPSSA